jgi:protein-tyrosine-phosphatase
MTPRARIWTRHLKAGVIEPYSAGIEKHGLNPHAVHIMAEAGVDISRQHSKTPAELGPIPFDYVLRSAGTPMSIARSFRHGPRLFMWDLKIRPG